MEYEPEPPFLNILLYGPERLASLDWKVYAEAVVNG